jgi:phytoene synthase
LADQLVQSVPRSVPASPRVAASLAFCERVARTKAGNFYHGMKLTPQPRRAAIYTVYAFMRACDDLADDTDADATAQRRANIETFRAKMDHAIALARDSRGDDESLDTTEPSVWPAFIHVMRNYPIDPADLHHMLDGQRADLDTHRYETFAQLRGYCYNVASTVGLVCVAVWGMTPDADAAHARQLAEQRGIALQLTNILRDLREDAQRGRVYLPTEDLQRFGVSPEALTTGNADAAFDRLMRFQIDRARGYYAASTDLDRFITPNCRPTSWAIMRIYEKLLDKIERDPRKVLQKRVSLNLATKVGVALRALRQR